MDRDFLIQLTNDIYKLTILFPQKEPLRYRLRGVALDILESQDVADFEVMDRFLEVAKRQNWVKVSEVLSIQANYVMLRGVLPQEIVAEIRLKKPEIPAQEPPKDKRILVPAAPADDKDERNERQDKIIDFIKTKEKTQVWELKQVFPEVSKRTLRRDFEALLKQGVIERLGERNNTFYQIKVI
jgi:hypothetical protein